LDTKCLSAARKLAETEQQLARRLHERQTLAVQRRQDALQRLVADPSGPLDEPVSQYVAEAPWVDLELGKEHPIGVGMIRDARRLVASQVDSAVSAQGARIFEMVREKAAEVVADVAALPPEVWSLNHPGEALAKYPAHRATYGLLLSAQQMFGLCHTVADLFRDFLGYSQDQLDGAPSSALAYRNWHAVLSDPQWLNIRGPLKLKYACERGFEPGLWLPSEVEIKAEDKTFGARLKNLGSAVFSGS